MKTLTFKEVQLEELNSVPWNVKIAVAGGVGVASGVAKQYLLLLDFCTNKLFV